MLLFSLLKLLLPGTDICSLVLATMKSCMKLIALILHPQFLQQRDKRSSTLQMCAMALVHQRIRRIFHALPNPEAGALRSVHRLQGEKSLNHYYAVFRVVLPEEVIGKTKLKL